VPRAGVTPAREQPRGAVRVSTREAQHTALEPVRCRLYPATRPFKATASLQPVHFLCIRAHFPCVPDSLGLCPDSLGLCLDSLGLCLDSLGLCLDSFPRCSRTLAGVRTALPLCPNAARSLSRATRRHPSRREHGPIHTAGGRRARVPGSGFKQSADAPSFGPYAIATVSSRTAPIGRDLHVDDRLRGCPRPPRPPPVFRHRLLSVGSSSKPPHCGEPHLANAGMEGGDEPRIGKEQTNP
jgi:hypothetical protein